MRDIISKQNGSVLREKTIFQFEGKIEIKSLNKFAWDGKKF